MYIYYERDIRLADEQAKNEGISLATLMENAGKSLYTYIKQYVVKADSLLILAGKGNNGGDGVVLAKYFKRAGYRVSLVFPVGQPKSETAIQHLNEYEREGFSVDTFDRTKEYDVIIDCLLGIGSNRPLQSKFLEIIQWCNRQNARKIAIDIPTGVHSDQGEVGEAFHADYTFCLHGIKPSAILSPSSAYYGRVVCVPIGLEQKNSGIRFRTIEDVKETLPKRSPWSHKGTFGTGLIIAGSDPMPGSAVLSAIGAIRSGIGKLTIATTRLTASAIVHHVPEATFILGDLDDFLQLEMDDKLRAIAIGPGLSNQEKVERILAMLLKKDIPLVVDAGALLPFSNWERPSKNTPTILTPHPGEFSRLMGYSIPTIEANRIELARKYALDNLVTVVLKGQYTVIAYPDGDVIVNRTGNSGLAKGGSGDVLTGMITSMLATHDNWRHAVANAVYLHGLCAEYWSKENSETSMTASDFKTLLPVVLKGVENNN